MPCQVFVESLDRTFENVCELDLVFHFDEVRSVSPGMPSFFNTVAGTPYSRRDHPGWRSP